MLFLPRKFLIDVGCPLLVELELGLKEVLDVGLADVLGEWAVSGEEQQREVQRLGVVRFTIFLGHAFDVGHLFLQNESDLRGHTEVGRCYENYFLEHCVLGQLVSVFDTSIQLLFLHHVQVHHVSNVQVENPVLSVFHA